MEILHPEEILSRDELDRLQTERLRKTVERCLASPFYQRRLSEARVTPDSIKSLDDARRIPFTTKEDLRSQYPYGLLVRPKEEMIRLHASSGTTGSPTVIFHTRDDIDNWADLMARSLHAAGVRPRDVFQNTTGYGLFTGGLGMHYGAERLGCLTVPSGPGNTKRQLKLMRDFHVTVAHIIPSYALYLAQSLESEGLTPGDLYLKRLVIGAEPHSEEARQRIQDMLKIKAYNSYGLSEMNGPGVAFECEAQNGLHLWEDAYLAEIVDPETGELMPEGEYGELVMTSLNRKGMPILRYRTRDLTRFIPGVCICGRCHRRMDRVKGRTDDMLIIKGVNVYPMQIEQVLMGIPEVGQNYLIILERQDFIDQMRVQVEMKEDIFADDMRTLGEVQKRIARRLADEILFTPKIELVQHNSLPKSDGKAQRVIDLRGKS